MKRWKQGCRYCQQYPVGQIIGSPQSTGFGNSEDSMFSFWSVRRAFWDGFWAPHRSAKDWLRPRSEIIISPRVCLYARADEALRTRHLNTQSKETSCRRVLVVSRNEACRELPFAPILRPSNNNMMPHPIHEWSVVSLKIRRNSAVWSSQIQNERPDPGPKFVLSE